MNSPTPPAPPDPYKTAAAQTGTNIASGIAQQQLNSTNQVTPYGNLTYSQSGMQTVTDPSTGKTYQIPQMTATQTLSPEQQGLFDSQMQAQQQYGNIANAQLGRVGEALGQPVDLGPEAIQKQVGDYWHSGLDPVWTQRQSQLESQLANKGLRVGDSAFTQAMTDFGNQRDAAYNEAQRNSQGQAMQQILAARNQPLNETSALMRGSQVQAPNFTSTPQAGVSSANLEGDVYNSYKGQMDQYGAQQAQSNGMWGSLANMGGAVLANGWMLSDPDAKTDKVKVTDLRIRPSVGLYKFRYKGSPFQQMGVMADEVERVLPDAVRTRPDGYREVNYDMVEEALE